MTDSKLLDKVQAHASPDINLSYVIDQKGKFLLHFSFHPQIGEDIIVRIEEVSTTNNERRLTTDDVRGLGEKLIEFADVVEAWITRYYKKEL